MKRTLKSKQRMGKTPTLVGADKVEPARKAKPELNPSIDPLIPIADVMRALGIRDKSTVYRQIQRGDFPAPVKIGASSRWPTSWIADLIEKKKAATMKGRGQ